MTGISSEEEGEFEERRGEVGERGCCLESSSSPGEKGAEEIIIIQMIHCYNC
jgi:hypothetical protein